MHGCTIFHFEISMFLNDCVLHSVDSTFVYGQFKQKQKDQSVTFQKIYIVYSATLNKRLSVVIVHTLRD